MRYYPINLDIRERGCLVVGGGKVAARKVATLVRCGARVTVVSPAIVPELLDLVKKEAIVYHHRPYESRDQTDQLLIFAATDNSALNQRILGEAQEKGRLCNVSDDPAGCGFTLPAVVSRGDLTIAISTAGKSPALAKQLRRQLQALFGEEYESFLNLMGAIRQALLRRGHDPGTHGKQLRELIDRDLLTLVKQGDIRGIDDLLTEVLGEDFTHDELLPPKVGDR